MKSKNQWLFEAPFTSEVNPSASQSYHSNPELESTPNPVIDPRIDVSAQRALMTMLNSSPTDRAIASMIISEVKSGGLRGLYQEDQQVPAMIARSVNKGWWQLLSPGQNSRAIGDLSINPCTFVFRRNLTRLLLIQELRLNFSDLAFVCLPP